MPGRREPDQGGVRIGALVALGLLLLAVPAAAGPVRLEIETVEVPRDPFAVTVTGHYADLHNGTSRTWKRALVPADGPRWLPLGPVNWLLNMGVSLWIYHPEYVADHYLVITQGPGIKTPGVEEPEPGGGTVESRVPGLTGRYGWQEKVGMPYFRPDDEDEEDDEAEG